MKARADLITYNMSGIIQSTAKLPVAVGDHITWTLQYDRAIPLSSSLSSDITYYSPKSPVITNIVDQSNGMHLATPASSTLQSTLFITRVGFVASDGQNNPTSASITYYTSVRLETVGPLPTRNLSDLQLEQIPIPLKGPYPVLSDFIYSSCPDGANPSVLIANVNSVSLSTAPEPGSLALFLVGVIGVTVSRFRRRCPASRAGG